MAKRTTLFVCQGCGSAAPKWLGRCPDCGAWGSLVEEAVPGGGSPRSAGGSFSPPSPVSMDDIPEDSCARLATGSDELDRVLGGGLTAGSTILLGGDPGVGKSTLLLQLLSSLAGRGERVLYVTAEESARQIRMRAQRVERGSEGSGKGGGANLLVLAATEWPAVREAVRAASPRVLVLDSVQTLYDPEIASAPGSISQVREIAAGAAALAKSMEMATWLVGHVTKDGSIAGPRTMEHLVDTVLYFEGETAHAYRILRAVKNRFGSTNEIALLEMTGEGLVQVADPASLFLPAHGRRSSGSAVAMAMEGTRPLLVEVQALAAPTPFSNPRRTVSGVDLNRLLLILAILEKRTGVHTGALDVFVNVAGGLRLTEPAADLALALAVAGSLRDRPMPEGMVVCGELGLSGEVRGVPRLDARLREAQRLGFTTALIPAAGPAAGRETPPAGEKGAGIRLLPVATLAEALDEVF
jgi:DNA repair protein RadA/Sms